MARYNLKSLRADLGITQSQLADALNVSQGFLCSVERGRNPFPDERVEDLRALCPEGIVLEDYEEGAPEKEKKEVGCNNVLSYVSVNNIEAWSKLLTAFMEKSQSEEKKKARTNDTTIDYEQRWAEALAELEKIRREKYELKDEVYRLRELLIRNNIEFEKE